MLTRRIRKENIEVVLHINITKEGVFTCMLPDDVVEKFDRAGIELALNRVRKKGFYQSESLNGLLESVGEDLDKYSQRKLIEEKMMLKYAVETKCHYCKTKSGEIVPNGYWVGDRGEGHIWHDGTGSRGSCGSSPYGLSVSFDISMRKVYEFPDKTRVSEYEHIDKEAVVKKGSTLD